MGTSRGVEITITLNEAEITKKIETGVTYAQKVLDAQILKDSNKYCPLDTSALQKSGINSTVIGSGLVVWSTPYARRQYYEAPNKSLLKNPFASCKWFEVAKSKNEKTWVKIANDEFSKNFK